MATKKAAAPKKKEPVGVRAPLAPGGDAGSGIKANTNKNKLSGAKASAVTPKQVGKTVAAPVGITAPKPKQYGPPAPKKAGPSINEGFVGSARPVTALSNGTAKASTALNLMPKAAAPKAAVKAPVAPKATKAAPVSSPSLAKAGSRPVAGGLLGNAAVAAAKKAATAAVQAAKPAAPNMPAPLSPGDAARKAAMEGTYGEQPLTYQQMMAASGYSPNAPVQAPVAQAPNVPDAGSGGGYEDPYGNPDYLNSFRTPTSMPDLSFDRNYDFAPSDRYENAFGQMRNDEMERRDAFLGLNDTAEGRYQAAMDRLYQNQPTMNDFVGGYDESLGYLKDGLAFRNTEARNNFQTQLGEIRGMYGNLIGGIQADAAQQNNQTAATLQKATGTIANTFGAANTDSQAARAAAAQGVTAAGAAAAPGSAEADYAQKYAAMMAAPGTDLNLFAAQHQDIARGNAGQITGATNRAATSNTNAAQASMAGTISDAYGRQEGNLNDLLFKGADSWTNMLNGRAGSLGEYAKADRGYADSEFDYGNETSKTQNGILDNAYKSSDALKYYMEGVNKLDLAGYQEQGLDTRNTQDNFTSIFNNNTNADGRYDVAALGEYGQNFRQGVTERGLGARQLVTEGGLNSRNEADNFASGQRNDATIAGRTYDNTYSSDNSRAASEYAARTSASASMYGADSRAETSVYNTDTVARINQQRADDQRDYNEGRLSLDEFKRRDAVTKAALDRESREGSASYTGTGGSGAKGTTIKGQAVITDIAKKEPKRAAALQGLISAADKAVSDPNNVDWFQKDAYAWARANVGSPEFKAAYPGLNPTAVLQSLEEWKTGRKVSGSTPKASGGYTPTQGGDVVSRAIRTIAGHESGGKNIPTSMKGSAQGYFQYTNGTWRSAAKQAGVSTAQYPTAMSAPYSVQEKVAAADISRILKASGGNVAAIPATWYLGHVPTSEREWNTIPRPDYGNTQTVRQYSNAWIAKYNKTK